MTTASQYRFVCAAGALAVAALCLFAVHSRAAEPTLTPRAARKAAPDFALIDASGSRVSLSGFKGRVVLLDFWATWCTGCKVEIPWYVEFQDRYRTPGLTSVGVAMDEEGWDKVTPYLAEHPISYPVVIGNLDLLQNTFGLAASLPVTLLIDRDGRVAESHAGMVDRQAFERDIRQLLREKPNRQFR